MQGHLQHVGDDVPLTLLQEAILVEGGIHLEDLRQHLGHFCLGEQSPCKHSSVSCCHCHQQSRDRQSPADRAGAGKATLGTTPAWKLHPRWIPRIVLPPCAGITIQSSGMCPGLAAQGGSSSRSSSRGSGREQSRDVPRTYEVGDAVGDGARRSDEGVVALVVLHLHLKEPCRGNRDLRALPDHLPAHHLQDPSSPQSLCSVPGTCCELVFSLFYSPFYSPFSSLFFSPFSCDVLISQQLSPLLPLRFNTSGKEDLSNGMRKFRIRPVLSSAAPAGGVSIPGGGDQGQVGLHAPGELFQPKFWDCIQSIFTRNRLRRYQRPALHYREIT